MADVPEIKDVDRPESLNWRVERLAPEENLQGFVAGPPVRVYTHFLGGRTQPCRLWLTRGKMSCACEQGKMAVRVTGYLPLILPNGERVVMVVSDKVAKKFATLANATPIQISRPRALNAPFKIRQLDYDALSGTMRVKVSSAGPHDIFTFLLHLWQNRELTVFFAMEFYPSEATRIAMGE